MKIDAGMIVSGLVIILLVITGLFIYNSYNNSHIANEYCKSVGYDEAIRTYSDFKCYKCIPHESSVGCIYEHSGIIKIRDIK